MEGNKQIYTEIIVFKFAKDCTFFEAFVSGILFHLYYSSTQI